MNKIEELICLNCKSKDIWVTGEDGINDMYICKNCNYVHEIYFKPLDKLSKWMWRKHLNKKE